MDIADSFSMSYRQARGKFLDAAQACGARLEGYRHPALKGPAGEDLCVDVAVLGAESCEQAMMVISGTHGVEGHAGSACQVHLLRSGFCTHASASTRVVLVHAINPYGFAYSRRTNEDNVDLNRNFVDFSVPLPVNSSYAEHAAAFLPSGHTLQDFADACRHLDEAAAARGGYEFFKKAMQPGQYQWPEGLYYGGAHPSWSSSVFVQLCDRFVRKMQRVAILDVHTGLGARGVGELVFMRHEDGTQYGSRFAPPVSCAGVRASVSASVQGPLVSAARDRIAAAQAICCALEFGTVPLRENVHAKIFENWTHRTFAPGHPLRQESSRRMRDAYFCDDDDWKSSVIQRATDVVHTLQECLSAERTA